MALGGAAVAFVPGAPQLDLPPELILAIFVAPILIDAAYDASLRDLRADWRIVLWLVLVAVGLTTAAVAVTARLLVPDLSWAAAVALGALLSPPDAVAALAVLRQVNPPYRIRKVLEGESLLNDASALLTYKLALLAVAAGHFDPLDVAPAFVAVVGGSVVAGLGLAWVLSFLLYRLDAAPTAVIAQFVSTFAIWVVAERLGLSPVVTLVVFGAATGQRTSRPMSARLRVASFAIWESATAVLNILAFALIGLQLRPIMEGFEPSERVAALGAAGAILVVVIVVRFVGVLAYQGLASVAQRAFGGRPPMKGALVVGWSGMRGIVTLAAALALPADFPHRDFALLTAFVVVLGTLVLQGLTLRPLLGLLGLPTDGTVDCEVGLARRAALEAALADLGADATPAAQRLALEYEDALAHALRGEDPRATHENELRRQVLGTSRRALENLRATGTIGDDAYRLVEEELDRIELSALPSRVER